MTNEPIQLRLYISGKSPNSMIALKNLQAICEEHLSDSHHIEVIDLFEHPYRAIEDGVMLTPLLVIPSSPPVSIIGNLSDAESVLNFLTSASKNHDVTE
ncbi:MAG TPA: circadian clock KaiB family protein [Methylotenera sp.]|nr:circadian clock KaiB family protein [Methylotenera sp.]